jgi:diphosphomevalonate decarboxylase
MPREVTAEAPSNIALIKYWGASDLDAAVPRNRSLSMTLDRCRSVCSATFFEGERGDDEILLEEDGVLGPAPESFRTRIAAHLDRLRAAWGRHGTLRIATRNTFPAAAGIASSASGFTALTLATSRALGIELCADELSTWSRRSGSGSAARSAFGGYVEWPRGQDEAECYAVQVADREHWPLCDLVAITSSGAKEVSSLEGHRRASTSPYFERRQELLPARLEEVRGAIAERDFARLADTVDEESIDLHLIMMSSVPPIFYWQPATVAVLDAVRRMRRDGALVCATMDAGPNVHVLCPPAEAAAVEGVLQDVPGVERVLADRTGGPPVWREGAEL